MSIQFFKEISFKKRVYDVTVKWDITKLTSTIFSKESKGNVFPVL
jgi:hypothetical protein